MKQKPAPVIVIGAGPVGLAAAAELAERGQEFLLLEAGRSVGASIRQWQHIKLFSPWKYDVAPAVRRLLEARPQGWAPERETKLPTGRELVEQYLEPLAAHPLIAPRLLLSHRVIAVSRMTDTGRGLDRLSSRERDDALFLVRAETPSGVQDLTARAVIDASGTWPTPNPIGRAGLPARGEEEARASGKITSPLPDPMGVDYELFAGRRILVLGAGHSAANTLIALGRLRTREPGTQIFWGLRGEANPIKLYGGGASDQLPARGQLGQSQRRLVDTGAVTLLENLSVVGVKQNQGAVQVEFADQRALEVDYIVPAVGFRPDLSLYSELRLDLDEIVQAPRRLAPLIDPAFHSCGTVSAHGFETLAHPERNFYVAGMKSYGRAPTFLLATGYEQVRSIVAELSGDHSAASAVELDLPETGVCSSSLDDDGNEGAAGGSCCSAPQPVSIGFPTGTLHGYSQLEEPR